MGQTKARFMSMLLEGLTVCCGVYTFLILLRLCGAYSGLKKDSPALLIGYVSLIHVIAIPLLFISFKFTKKGSFPFLVLNGLWLGAILILLILINFTLKADTKDLWDRNPLNHMLITFYFIDALILEIITFMQVRENMKIHSTSPKNSVESNKSNSESEPKPKSKSKPKTKPKFKSKKEKQKSKSKKVFLFLKEKYKSKKEKEKSNQKSKSKGKPKPKMPTEDESTAREEDSMDENKFSEQSVSGPPRPPPPPPSSPSKPIVKFKPVQIIVQSEDVPAQQKPSEKSSSKKRTPSPGQSKVSPKQAPVAPIQLVVKPNPINL